ncbi:MAG: hypothetical protein JXB25_00330 [Deltaproteobacteria bacterium]|nr:hypothetical protein [Deltaproteobacteria bacterium]
MESESYRIVLLGIEAGQDPQQVKQQLAQGFRSSMEEVERLFAKIPVVVRSNLDRETADRYREAIARAGASCRIEAMKKSGKAPAAPAATATPLKICPGCGYRAVTPDDPLITAHGGLGECPSCGIIVGKYHPAKNQTQAVPPPSPAAGKVKKRSPWFWLGAVAAVLAALVLLGAIAQFTLCKISLSRFMTQVGAFDRKGYALDSQQNLAEAIGGLHHLYNVAAESNPLFSWSRFNPDGRFGKFYDQKTVETMIAELTARRETLLNEMREAADDGKLFDYPLDRIDGNLRQFEFCIVRKLERMTSRRRGIEKALENLAVASGNVRSCRGIRVGPLPERLKPEYYGVSATEPATGSRDRQPSTGRSYADIMKERGPILNGLRALQGIRDNWRGKNQLGGSGFPTREEVVSAQGEGAWPGALGSPFIPGAEFFFLADGTPACRYKGKIFTQESRELYEVGDL